MACGGDSSNNSSESVASCTVSSNADSTAYILSCPDGTEVEVVNGKDGSDGKDGKKGSDGKSESGGKNGEDGSDGKKDSAGEGCTIKELDGGSISLTCPDGTSLVFNSDGKVTPVVSSDSKSPKSSSSGKTDEKSSSSKKTAKGQGYVQFNADVLTLTAGNAIYLYDEDNLSQTAKVDVYSVVAADTITLTLNRHDQYFYAPFQMSIYGGNGNVLKVERLDSVVVEYKDASTGATEIDGATVSLPTGNKVSLAFGRTIYSDTLDKAVITLIDSNLTADVVVTVKVATPVDTSNVTLYPVEGGNGTERIGFVGFAVRDPLEGEVEVVNGTVTVIYEEKIASTRWNNANGSYGLVCSKDGEIQKGLISRDTSFVCDLGEFRPVSEMERSLNKGCTSYTRKKKNDYNNFYYYVCTDEGWNYYRYEEKFDKIEIAEKEYFTIKIGSQIWMADDGVCPSGFHVPDGEEWTTLYDYVGQSVDSLVNVYGFSRQLKVTYARSVDGKTSVSDDTYYPAIRVTQYYVSFLNDQMSLQTNSYSTQVGGNPGGYSGALSLTNKCLKNTEE